MITYQHCLAIQYQNVDADYVTDHRYNCITTKEDQENELLWQLHATGIRLNQSHLFPLTYDSFFFFFLQRCELKCAMTKGSVNFV